MKRYTPDELQRTLMSAVRDNLIDRAIFASMKALEGTMKNRIFARGLNSDNGKIGNYSRKPISFPVKQMPNPSAFGGKKSIYSPNGYYGIRRLAGRQNNYVDLKFTGGLQAAITTTELEGEYAIVIVDKKEAKKLRDNEKRFNSDIGEPTKAEKAKFIRDTSNTIQMLILNKIGK